MADRRLAVHAIKAAALSPLAYGLAAVLIAGAVSIDGFFSGSIFGVVLDRGAVAGVVALGVAISLIAGQLDLSVGSNLALSGIVTIIVEPHTGMLVAGLIGVLVGLVIGLVNGVIVVVLGVHSLIVTLGGMIALRALAHLITHSQPVSGNDPLAGLFMVQELFAGVSLQVIIFLVGVIVVHVFLTQTVPGRNLLAVGGNRDAAVASGLRADRYTLGAMVACGGCAGLGGAMLSIGVDTGSPMFGNTILITIIAAVVIGGTSLDGGRGSAIGTLAGVLAISILQVVMEFNNVAPYMQSVVLGLSLVVLVVADEWWGPRRRLLLSR